MHVHPRHALPNDASSWEEMRRELWPDGVADHGPEIASFFAGTLKELAAVLVAENPFGEIVGFVELSIRLDLAAFEGKPVRYVEGLYVLPEVRRRGLVRKLLQAARTWAHQQKCSAFPSDRADWIIIDRSFSKALMQRKKRS